MAKAKSGMPEGIKVALGWSVGIAAIALVLIITLIIFGNLSGNLGFTDGSVTITNETGGNLNATGYTVTERTRLGYVGITVSEVLNATAGAIIPAANYTVNSADGTITNATVLGNDYESISINITYAVTFDKISERNAESVIGNFSESAVNTAAQFPTVGTIIGIALLLVVLIGILVFAIRKMMGVAGATGSSKGFA